MGIIIHQGNREDIDVTKRLDDAGEIMQDQTMMYVIINFSKLNYGVVGIANLFSTVEENEAKEFVDLEKIKLNRIINMGGLL